MTFTPTMVGTFVLLALSISAVWAAALRVGESRVIQLWPILFAAAILGGLAAGALTLPAIIALGALVLAAVLATREQSKPSVRFIFAAIAAFITLALAFHQLPGFNNPVLIEKARFSAEAETYTQWANFDKAAAGLVILAFFCRRARSAAEWRETLTRTLPVAAVTAAVVITAALLIGYVRPSFKLPAYTPIFLVTNLLFTCVAEEAFFRGFLQHQLAHYLESKQIARAGVIAPVICAVLFGIVHAGGGAWYLALSTLAGLGYGYAYLRAQSVEAPILAHFALNAVHFVGFTYPRVA